jgi:hypothetical protein
MKSKVFDNRLHDENDLPARAVVKRFYAHLGIILQDNPDRYGVDLISDDGKVAVEVERRPVWNKNDFPFVEVNFLHRKVKFFEKAEYLIQEYAIVSESMARIGIVDRPTIMEIVNRTKPTESCNRFVNDSEFFYKIPRSKFTWFSV